MYTLITSSEDGDIRIKKVTKEEILLMVNEAREEEYELDFFESLDNVNSDPMYWGEGNLLIKGDIVSPDSL